MNSNTPPWHPGMNMLNTNVVWQSPGEKVQFEKLMADPVSRQYLTAKGWDKPEAISYKLNSHGFRCEEFDSTPCLVVLGCSHTFGIGLPDKDVWGSLVGAALGLKVVNLGWPGQSADYCFRMAEYWLARLPVEHCVMLTPPEGRIEIITQKQTETFMPGSVSNYYNPQDWFLSQWIMNEENHRINNLKNKLAIKQLCSDAGISCQIYDSDIDLMADRKNLDYARDYMHHGPNAHKMLAEKILNEH